MACSKCAQLKRIALTQLEHQYALRYQKYGTKANVSDLDARREYIEKSSKCKKGNKKVTPEDSPEDTSEPSTDQNDSLDDKLV